MACSLASAIVAHKEQGATGAKPDVSQCAQAPRVIDSFHDSFTVRQNPTHTYSRCTPPHARAAEITRDAVAHTRYVSTPRWPGLLGCP